MIKFTLILAAILSGLTLSAQMIVTHPLCDNRVDPLGVDSRKPAFCWVTESNKPAVSKPGSAIPDPVPDNWWCRWVMANIPLHQIINQNSRYTA